MIVGAEASSCTEITEFFGRGQAAGRLSVAVAVDPPVDQASARLQPCPSFDPDPPVANGRYRATPFKCRFFISEDFSTTFAGATHPETISDRGSAPAAPGRVVTHCSEIGFFMGKSTHEETVDAFAAVVCAAGS